MQDISTRSDICAVILGVILPRHDGALLPLGAPLTVLAPYRALLAARLFLCLLCRRSLTLCQARDHGKSGSLIRSSALLPRSKLGTRHTQTTCTLPPDNRQNAVVSNRFGGSRPRRSSAPRARRSTWRGDRHPVRCRWRVGASLRLGGGLHGSARRRCADCTTPAPLPHHSHWEWCSSYGTAHRSRAPLPCAIRSGGGPGGVLPLMGVAFPRGLPSHELATPS